ncbi:MAG: hypothetical protein ACPKQO_11230 [Nitrososphaeraceae archaeon]
MLLQQILRTSYFIDSWSTGEDSLAIYVPNAVLVVDEQEGKRYCDNTIVESNLWV